MRQFALIIVRAGSAMPAFSAKKVTIEQFQQVQGISALQRFRYCQLGAATGASGIVTVIGWVIARLTR